MTKRSSNPADFFSQGVPSAIAFGLVLILAAATWAPHLTASLWLDETLTSWVVKDGFAEMLDRAVHYQSQSAYYVFLWFWTQIAGTSELALRLPSLMAALGSCWVLARLGASLTRDRETGLLAMVVFASTWNVYREAVDARSYMPGVFILLCLALCLVRWLDRGRWRDAWLCGLLAALLPHFHLFLGLTLPAFAVYAALRWAQGRGTLPQFGLIALILLIGALLFIPAAETLVANGGAYSFAPKPRWGSLVQIFDWGPPVAGLLAGICAAGVIGSRRRDDPSHEDAAAMPIERDAGLMLAIWALSPLLILFSVAMWSDLSIFLERFLIPATPAVCLFYAMALRAIPSGRARILAVLVIALAAFATQSRPVEDFRGAMRSVNGFVGGDASVPVLFASGLIEGQHEEWLRNPAHAEYLKAPMSYYPSEGRVIIVPRRLHGQPLGIEIVDPVLRDAQRFAAIEWAGNGANILKWLSQRAERAGFKVERRAFGNVRVAIFRHPETRSRK